MVCECTHKWNKDERRYKNSHKYKDEIMRLTQIHTYILSRIYQLILIKFAFIASNRLVIRDQTYVFFFQTKKWEKSQKKLQIRFFLFFFRKCCSCCVFNLLLILTKIKVDNFDGTTSLFLFFFLIIFLPSWWFNIV